MEMLTAPANLAFTVALAIVLLLGALEVISLLLGADLGLFDTDMPEADLAIDTGVADGVHGAIEGGADGLDGGDSMGTQLLEWLHVGQIPAMILLILFLLSFGIGGLLLQIALVEMRGTMLSGPMASLLALVMALPATRVSGGVLKRVLPQDHSEAVSRDSFIGQSAQVTLGTARRGAPAEARLRDNFGKSHYVMVEPDHDGETFSSGSHVLILKRHGDIYRVIENTHALLED